MKILSCGAGMQSTALALMSCEKKKSCNEIYPQVPIYDAILFCDLGEEPKWVYDQVYFIQCACEDAGIPFYVLESNLYSDYVKNFGKSRVVSIPFWTGINISGECDIESNMLCPSCKHVVGNYEWDELYFNFCPDCGQKLKYTPEE